VVGKIILPLIEDCFVLFARSSVAETLVDIHTSLTDEVSVSGTWHSGGHGSANALYRGGDAVQFHVRCNLRKGGMTLILLIVAAFLVPGSPKAQNPTPVSTTWRTVWSYEGARGPEHWGDLDPAYATCKDGKEQSPIDIRSAEKADLPAIRFEYKSGPLNIINNGFTAVRVDYSHSGDFLVVGDKRYELKQFHFHRPSEEYIDGQPYDMVLHLLHVASDAQIAGVAVLLKAGTANATVQRLWEHMPKTAGKLEEIPGVEVNPAGLLPHNTGYYTYKGSQTAPPCTEGVTWFVLKSPMEISTEQIDAFAKLYPHDVRPVQPLHGRAVKESR
jgi:carbonic anhydrase